MKVERFIFGPFQTNCYVVSNEQQVLLIDPACYTPFEHEQLYNFVEKQTTNSQKPIAILATHGHLDHLWGAAWATETWHTPVLMHEADIPLAGAMQQQYDMFGIRQKAVPFPIKSLSGEAGLSAKRSVSETVCQRSGLSIIPTPGHTPGSICLYFPQSPISNLQSPILFSGDTLFHMGYGRTDLPGGNFAQLMDSLKRLMTLPPSTRVLPGHGEPTSIAINRLQGV